MVNEAAHIPEKIVLGLDLSCILKDHHRERAAPAAIHFDSTQVPVAKTGFVGTNKKVSSGHYGVKDMRTDWYCRSTIPLVDKEGRVWGVLAGQPNDPQWAELHVEAADALESHRNRCVASKKKPNRRGKFNALRCGISHGGGQSQPCNHANDSASAAVLEELNSMKVFQRLAGFSSSVMANWVPDLHSYYVEYLGKLYTHNPSLKHTFKNSVFAATTYNFGPQTVCFKHMDRANLPFGWCSITALGSFDHTKGGHLILWECGLVIEFPAGSTVLFPPPSSPTPIP
ncbi:hypothetical protein CPC08DRAFT_769561 [Agrocybe pediades]|nr:hypothetical protein CPC08DRAFT_769561 [Agrocybe pediades]